MSWEHKGVRIEINQHGQFIFDEKDSDGEAVTNYSTSLDVARAKIDTYLKQTKPEDLALECLLVVQENHPKRSDKPPTYRVLEVVAVGVNANTSKVRFKPKVEDIDYGPFPKSDKIRVDLEAYVKLKMELDRLTEKLEPFRIPEGLGYGRIDAAKLPDKLQELMEAYVLAVNGKGVARRKGW